MLRELIPYSPLKVLRRDIKMNEQVDTQKVDRKIPRKQFYAYGVMYGSNNITNVARGLYIATYPPTTWHPPS